MASLVSSTRSAARATYSAYKRQPIRWRLAGGSAALTLVILLGFAVIVGTLTTRAIYKRLQPPGGRARPTGCEQQLQYDVRAAATRRPASRRSTPRSTWTPTRRPPTRRSASSTPTGARFDGSADAPDFGAARPADRGRRRLAGRDARAAPVPGHRQLLRLRSTSSTARRISDVRATANRVKLFLGLGVLGGAALALLAGLATARRAMEPIAELTDAAREIERTRDPSLTIPRPRGRRRGRRAGRRRSRRCSHALDEARAETEATLARQREFVADASHELRTPLTSVLANLELLEETLDGRARARRPPPRCARAAACAGSSPTCCCSRAPDAGREPPHRPVDLSERRRRGRRRARARGGRPRDLDLRAAPGVEIEGVQDELHRLVLNLMENALRHTDPGTAVEASVERRNGHVVLAVEDDGPGIPPELHDKVFERFFRAHGDRSGLLRASACRSCKAVAESHHGTRHARAAARRPRRPLRRAVPGRRLEPPNPSSRGRYGRWRGGHV